MGKGRRVSNLSLLIYILLLQPATPMRVAEELATELVVQSVEGDDLTLAVAIAMQESSLLARTGSELDHGLFNLHLYTINDYGLDASSLKGTECVRCQVRAYYLIMRDKIRRCQRFGDEAWSCFHSATPKHRLKYVEDVGRYYNVGE